MTQQTRNCLTVALAAGAVFALGLGAYLGGKAFEATGSYDWMWWADIALCLMAAAVHLPIREPRSAPAQAARTAAA